jgi:hypothetical protein
MWLACVNENDVAVLLSFWCSANTSTAKPQLEELSTLLRVGRMSRSFRHFTLPKLSWFQSSAILPYFNFAFNEDDINTMRSEAMSFPRSWFGPARHPADAASAWHKLHWRKTAIIVLI